MKEMRNKEGNITRDCVCECSSVEASHASCRSKQGGRPGATTFERSQTPNSCEKHDHFSNGNPTATCYLQSEELRALTATFLKLLGYFVAVVQPGMRSSFPFGLRPDFRHSENRKLLDSSVTALISNSPADFWCTAYARDPKSMVDTVVYLDEEVLPEDQPAEVGPVALLQDPQTDLEPVCVAYGRQALYQQGIEAMSSPPWI